MANFLNYVVESAIQPTKTNVLWIKNGVPYYYNERWKPLLAISGGSEPGGDGPIIDCDCPVESGEGKDSLIIKFSNSIASGNNSVSLGYSLTAQNFGEVAFGKYNNSILSQNPSEATLFTIGNGTQDFLKNVFEIKYDGSIYIEGIEKSLQDYLYDLNNVEVDFSEILETIDGVRQEFNSKISQSAREILAEVNSSIIDLEGKIIESKGLINITAEQIRSEVSRVQTELSGNINKNTSLINQTAESIRSEVSESIVNLEGLISENNSKITQNANLIQSVVKSIDDINNSIDEQSTFITQTAEAIRAEVSEIESDLNEDITETKASIEILSNSVTKSVEKLEKSDESLSETIAEQSIVISDLEIAISSKVEQKDFDTLTGTVEEIGTRVTQTESDITSLVKRTTANETLISTISQTVDEISLSLENTKQIVDDISGDITEIQTTQASHTLSINELGATITTLATKESVDNLTGNYENLESRVTQTEKNITSKVSQKEYDAKTGELTTQYTEVKQTVDGISTTIKNIEGDITSIVEDIEGITVSIGTVEAEIGTLQNQIDGAIETYFLEGEPTNDNAPANEWYIVDEITGDVIDKRSQHLGDLYYDKITGYAYRYQNDKEIYYWHKISDQDITRALEEASKAQYTADGKSTTFIGDLSTETTLNYKEGDTWILPKEYIVTSNLTYAKGTLLTCITDYSSDKGFQWSDWEEAIKYTDDSKLDEFKEDYESTIGELQTQVDKKAETWYQSEDPSNNWTTEELKSLHIGDLWFNTSTQETFYWNGESWDKQDVPIEVFDRIDGKSSIYVQKPEGIAYKTNDLWVVDQVIEGFPYAEGTWVVAINDAVYDEKSQSYIWQASDWEKKDTYTDDSALENFIESYDKTIEELKTQLDGKAETWYQDTDPSLSWEDKELHIGDLWYNTSDGTTWYYTDALEWQEQEVPGYVFDSIDGKSSIYVEKPINGYHINDLWVLESPYTLNGVAYKTGTWVVATESSDSWVTEGDNASVFHWVKKDSYTDDTKVTELNNYIDDAFKDGVLSESEKRSISQAKKTVDANYKELEKEYYILIQTLYNDDSEPLKTAFANLEKAKASLDEAVEDLINSTEKSEFEDLKTAYDNAYSDYVNDIVAYREEVEHFKEALNANLNKANEYIADIASDNIITVVEKRQLLEVRKRYDSEFSANKGIAKNYDIIDYDSSNNVIEGTRGFIISESIKDSYYEIYVDYSDAYYSLQEAFNEFGLEDLTENTTLTGEYSLTEFEERLNTYSSKLIVFSEAISEITIAIETALNATKVTLESLTNNLLPDETITTIGKGVILSSIIGVGTQNEETGEYVLKAGMNASTSASDDSSEERGRIVFAGGINNDNWNDSTFVVYENGHVKMTSGEISESVKIGGVLVTTSDESAKLELVTINDQLIFRVEYDDEGNIISIGTPYSFYSEKDISALGRGNDDGDEDISGIIILDSWDSYDATLPQVIGGILGLQLHERLTAVENGQIDLDLSKYATIEYVTNTINSVLGDVESEYNTLYKIQNILKGHTEDISNISAEIALKASKEELTTLDTKYEELVGNVTDRVDSHDTQIDELERVDTTLDERLKAIEWLGEAFVENNGTIVTSYNFASQGTVASLGIGEEGSGESDSSTLDGLLDVTIDFVSDAPTEENRQVLAYDVNKAEWTNKRTMYKHYQSPSSDVWTIQHGLNKVPNVKIIDSTGEQVYGSVRLGKNEKCEDPLNYIRVYFGGAFSGTAYLD